MPEWLARLVVRLQIDLAALEGQTWEQTFGKLAQSEQKLQDVYQKLVRLNAVSPVPRELVDGFAVFARNVYNTQLKLRGAAIRAGLPAARIPVPRLVVPPSVRTVAAGQSALAGVAVPLYRIGQLSRPAPGTVGALGAVPVLVYVGIAAAVIALGTVAVIWWRGVAATEAVAAVEVTRIQGQNLVRALDAMEQCVTAAGTNASAIAACTSVVQAAPASPATDIPRPGDEDPLAGVVRTLKSGLAIAVIGGIVYGGFVIWKKLRK